MSAINLLLACLGGGITLMVAIGMVFLAPRGTETSRETPVEQPRSRDKAGVDQDTEVAPLA